ncbi:MAG TPA: hypothetical protein VM933_08270 [Acidimicrobiales bacterium]|nr:hypothetical protein [Acidimicrobiales bacterium]
MGAPEKPTSPDAETEPPEVEADEPVEPVRDDRTGEELGEVAGGGGVTDLGGDSPSS